MNYRLFLLLIISFALLGCGKNVLNARVSTWRGPNAYSEIIRDGSVFAKKYGGFTETYDSPEVGKYWINCYDWDSSTSSYVFIGQSSCVERNNTQVFITEGNLVYFFFNK